MENSSEELTSTAQFTLADGRSLALRTIHARIGNFSHNQEFVIIRCRPITNPLPNGVRISK